MAEYYCMTMVCFNFIRNCHTVYQNGCIILHSYQQRMKVPVAPYRQKYLVQSVFWILASLMGV